MPGSPRKSESGSRPHSYLLDSLLPLAALWGYAVSQPLYNLLPQFNGMFFIIRRCLPGDVLLFVFFLSIVPPILLASLTAIALRFRPAAGVWLCRAFIALLAALIALFALAKLSRLPGAVGLVLGLSAGVAFAWGHSRFRNIRLFLQVLSPTALLFPIVFLGNPAIRKIAFPGTIYRPQYENLAPETPVVVVVFDEFNSTTVMNERQEIDAARFPNFAALAATSTWCRNASTVHDDTIGAVPSILTGLHPTSTTLVSPSNYPRNLFTLLGGTRDMVIYESDIPPLCPEPRYIGGESVGKRTDRMGALAQDLAIIYAQVVLPWEYARGLPQVTQSWNRFVERPGKEAAQIFEEFLTQIRPGRGPALYFVDCLLPHLPYQYLPSGSRYHLESWERYRTPGLDGGREHWTNEAWPVRQGWQRYILQSMYVDTLVGKLIARLKEAGIYDDCLLFITADHGVSFLPGESRRRVTQATYPEIMLIPFFMKAPHQTEGRILDANVQTIDVLPTIAELLGSKLPWKVEGSSIFDIPAGRGEKKRVFDLRWKEFEFSDAPQAREATLRRQLEAFGSGAESDALYRIGPYPEVLGRNLSELHVADAPDVEIELDQTLALENVTSNGLYTPTWLTGRLRRTASADESTTLAFAVNGIVRSTAPTYSDPGDPPGAFASLIPESSLRVGRNQVEAFVIGRGPDGLFLRRPSNRSLVGSKLKTSADGKAMEIVTPSGAIHPIKEGPMPEGVYEGAHVDREWLILTGWACDQAKALPASSILLLVRGACAFVGTTGYRDEGVAKAFGEAMGTAGFEWKVPLGLIGDMRGADIRLFSLNSDGTVTELNQPRETPWK